MGKHSSHQQRIIQNYYQNRDAIAVQRLQELVTELYLAEGKKRQRVWDRIETHMEKAGVKQAQIDHLRKKDNPELVASLVSKLLEKSA
jgi:hypothetical protein